MISNQDEFKILTDSDHARARPGMYIGSANIEPQTCIINGVFVELQIVPGLNKIVEEIYQNAVDDSIRNNFKTGTKIDITIGCDSFGQFIQVKDNGRGIPVEKTPEGWRPDLCWTRARSGTSFSEDRTTIGANGVGSFLTVVFSTKFLGESRDGKKKLNLEVNGDIDKKKVSVVDSTEKSGVTVKFYPDFSAFSGIESFTEDHISLLKNNIKNLAICFPKIKFTVNGEQVGGLSNKDLAKSIHEHAIGIETMDGVTVIAPLPKGAEAFTLVSFVNGINIKNGGSHIQYLLNGLIEEIRPLIKKKWKIEVSNPQIYNGFFVSSYLSNFHNLKFDSQTKERVTNTGKEVAEYFNFDDDFFKKTAKKIIENEAIIMPIIEAILYKKELEDRRELAKKQKLGKKIKVVNHIEAQSNRPEEKILFISEGQSAGSVLLSVRNANTTGGYCLRGKVMNTHGMRPSEILKNKEFFELCAVLGLEFGKDISGLTYHKICCLTDQDPDGDSIYASLLQFFSHWPDLFTRGHIYRAKSPLYVCKRKKDRKTFFSYADMEKEKLNSQWEINYIKGLGSLDQEDYSEVINNPTLVKIAHLEEEDYNSLNMAFGGDASLRKTWMLT